MLGWLGGMAAGPAAAAENPGTTQGDAVIADIDLLGLTRTRPEVVRRELLFDIGDTLSADLLAETERNLRRLLFLGDVVVRAAPSGRDSVRVVVEARDRYARALSPLLDGDLDEVSWGGVALDYNLFGTGQRARVTYEDDAVSGRRLHLSHVEPRLRGTRLRGAAETAWAEEGHTLGASLSKPFYALSAPVAYGISVASDQRRARLYGGGALAARYDQRVDAASAWWVRSCGDAVKMRPGVQLSVSDRTFDPVPAVVDDGSGPADTLYTYAPADRRRVLAAATLTLWRPRYVTDRYLRDLGPREDLQVGPWLRLAAGLSARALGSDRGYLYGAATLAPWHRTAGGWYLLTSLNTSGRWSRGRAWNLLTGLDAVAYRRLPDWRTRPTLVLRLAADRLDRPEDAGSQFLLGVDSGLRGTAPRALDGRKRVVAGVELRPLLHRDEAWILGGALFADTGAAWDERPVWHPAVGAGLRLGLPRLYDTPVLRVDVAHGVRDGTWQLAFGLGQYE